MKNKSVRWPVAILVAAVLVLLTYVLPSRITVVNDVTASLPTRDPVIADTLDIIGRQAFLNSLYLDLSLDGGAEDVNALAAAADRLKARLMESGLFRSVGTESYGRSFPVLMRTLAESLPSLFDEQELRGPVADRLRPDRLREAMRDNAVLLRGLEGFGQADLIARDPLGLGNLILANLALLLPSPGARIVMGHVFSSDRRHLLLPAQPVSPSTDVVFARRLSAFLDEEALALSRDPEFEGAGLRVIPFGAYRSTLDNERYSRSGAKKAAWISLIGISALLLVTFRRPLLGLLCLVPALAGTALALFVMSLSHRAISILAMGFGGALIGIAVDQGLAYLIFLDREQETTGWEASRVVLVVSLVSTLTTVGSFFALLLGGFPVLRQLGLFAGLGVFFAFLFVHLVFPLIFRKMPAARRRRLVPLDALTSPGTPRSGRIAVAVCLLLFIALAWFAKPEFRGNISSLNTISPETARAEKEIGRIWGDVLNTVSLMIEGKTPEDLWRRSDRLMDFLAGEAASGRIEAAFTPSRILPGPDLAEAHRAAWKAFWTPERAGRLRKDLGRIGKEFGFRDGAFDPFLRAVEHPAAETPVPEESVFPLLGVSLSQDQERWTAFGPVVPGRGFDRESFFRSVKTVPGVRVLDSRLFADHFARVVFRGFSRMLLICVAGLAFVLLLYFGELTVPAVVLGHTLFALVCTLGTLKLLGHPLNVPELAVAVIIPGMGSDFALYLARSHQRYLDERQPPVLIFRNAVFLSAAATMIGFAGLAVSEHRLLQSIGLAGLLSIGYSLLGAFGLLPPLLRRIFAPRPWPEAAEAAPSPAIRSRVLRRYRHLEIHPRLFARFKMLLDPMFPRLGDFVPRRGAILDVGCGYGVPGAWLLARFPGLTIHGLDPDPKRVRIARHVFGPRGTVVAGRAPGLPERPGRVDAAMLLDMAHYLSDADFRDTLTDLAGRIAPGGALVMRTVLPRAESASRLMRIELAGEKLRKRAIRFRRLDEIRDILAASGFSVELTEPSTRRGVVVWVIGKRRDPG
jgi:predicted exporter/SAM-dependent methyltransferase